MEHGVNSTTGTTADTAIAGGTTYYGFTAAVSAALTISIYNGTSASGELVDTHVFAAAGNVFHWFGPNGVRCNNGLFFDGVANITAYVLYHS